MKSQIYFSIDGKRIRFTPDGRVAVLDAIQALCDENDSQIIWPQMLTKWPQLSDVCSTYRFEQQEDMPVATRSGWEEIEGRLLDHLLSSNLRSVSTKQ